MARAKKPRKFTDLSPERQAKLVAHFVSEFDMSEADARADCETLEGEDFALHLDACENGYM